MNIYMGKILKIQRPSIFTIVFTIFVTLYCHLDIYIHMEFFQKSRPSLIAILYLLYLLVYSPHKVTVENRKYL
jgi:hypothetical protein